MSNENYKRRYLLQALAFEPQLRTCLFRLTRDMTVVPDLVQETWVHLLMAGAEGKPEIPVKSFRSYVISIAYNLARDWLRRRKIVCFDAVEDSQDLSVIEQETFTPERIISARQEVERLVAIVSAMPPKRQAVFTLRKAYELSHREIAERLGISEATVDRHLRDAAHDVIKALAEDQDVNLEADIPKKWRLKAAASL